MLIIVLFIFAAVFVSQIYARSRSIDQHPKQPPRPLSRITCLLLELLSATCVFALVSTFPYFHPEDILSRTRSSIRRTSAEEIFQRLHSLRPPIPSDEILKARFVSRAGRLLYVACGPGPLINCTWCGVDQPFTYVVYALPGLLIPHLVHTAILGVVTSANLLGGDNKAGGVWRTQATLAGVLLAVCEGLYIYIGTSLATEAGGPYWQLLTIRGIAFAILDAMLGYAIYLTGTGRWSGPAETPAETLETAASKLENSLVAVNSAICLKQAIMRDYELRERAVHFWEKEVLYAQEVAKDDHVRIARTGVEQREDWVGVKESAKRQASAIMRGLFGEVAPIEEAETEGGWQSEEGQTNIQLSTPAGSGYFTDGSQFTGMQAGESG